ncbi:MAG: redoxin domain-containing protein [Anaerolineae bacterium]|nr:redoxin domain-containing protein [Anaerolineae bacterium]
MSNLPRVRAPEFPANLEWLNVPRPLTLSDLRGKIVLLDFWTYGCVNCMHVIPDLKRLEAKYPHELVVIGVHTAKFDHEGETENIRRLVQRYELEHPVVNDRHYQIWEAYAVRAWPSFALIDPAGYVVGHHAGERIYGLFDTAIGAMVRTAESQGVLNRTPLELHLERAAAPDSFLRFPGKILADAATNRLFIADSNHHRIVITDLDGLVQGIIGSGECGLKDGSFAAAQFNRPQGLTLADAHTLYIADTENNTIRRADLARQQVVTVAGTGQQDFIRTASGRALELPLNTPWDALYHEGTLYIAMAGQHQLWGYSPTQETLFLLAGTGREALVDGPQLNGCLNQPSGLTTDGQRLYFADAEASAIRSAGLDIGGQLQTLVGTGLFDFGDRDGVGDEVLLQHPLAVVYHDGLIYLADTYNSKIKRLNPATREVTTFLGGERGWQDGVGATAQFDEPGGLTAARGRLYIADSNNHAIRTADLQTGQVKTLDIQPKI